MLSAAGTCLGAAHEDNYRRAAAADPDRSAHAVHHRRRRRPPGLRVAQAGRFALRSTSTRRRAAPHLILTRTSARARDRLPTVERAAAAMGPSPPRVLSLNPLTLDDVLRNVLEGGAAAGLGRPRAAHARLVERIGAVGRARAPTAPRRATERRVHRVARPAARRRPLTPELIERAGDRTRCTRRPRRRLRPVVRDQRRRARRERPRRDRVLPVRARPRRDAARAAAQRPGGAAAAVRGRACRRRHAMFNRPGPRLVDRPEWLAAVLRGAPEPRPPSEWLPPPPPPAAEPPRRAAPTARRRRRHARHRGGASRRSRPASCSTPTPRRATGLHAARVLEARPLLRLGLSALRVRPPERPRRQESGAPAADNS